MENVSKALILAGAIVIGVFLFFNFNNAMQQTGIFTQSYMSKLDKDRLTQYNADFNKYTGTQITIYDVATVINKALEINEACYFDETSTDYIRVNLDFADGIGTTYNGSNFLKNTKFYSDSTRAINYKEYNKIIFSFLEAYYDDTINWEGQAVEEPVDWEGTKIKKVEDAKIPAFYMTIDSYAEGQVSEITFTQDGFLDE